MNQLAKIDHEARLYVQHFGNGKQSKGYTCLGFEVLERDGAAICKWLYMTAPRGIISLSPGAEAVRAWHNAPLHSEARFSAYQQLCVAGAANAKAIGRRCDANLSPQLIGLEGHRVEVTDSDGAKRRFIVGKSTGWFPIHLEIAKSNSTGGGGAAREYASVRDLGKVRA